MVSPHVPSASLPREGGGGRVGDLSSTTPYDPLSSWGHASSRTRLLPTGATDCPADGRFESISRQAVSGCPPAARSLIET